MGCICGCHEKLEEVGVNGCCWKCEAEHDTLRNALLQIDALTKERDNARHDAVEWMGRYQERDRRVDELLPQLKEVTTHITATRCERDNALRLNGAWKRSVNECCECGGKGPQDPGVCLACKVYHLAHALADKRNHESVRETAERLGMRVPPKVIRHCKVTDNCADSDLCKCQCYDCRAVVEF